MIGRHGEKHVSIFVDKNTNYIHAEPIVDVCAASLLKATKRAIIIFTQRRFPIIKLRLDNQISDEVRQYLSKAQIGIELTPVGQHRRRKLFHSLDCWGR